MEKTTESKVVLEGLSTENGYREVKNGFMFLKRLRAEAKRQKDMEIAKNLEIQGKPIEEVPIFIHNAEIDSLADTMDIIEED